MDIENLPVLLQHISESFSERRLYESFIAEYTTYFEIDEIIMENARKGDNRIILFLYSCDTHFTVHEDGSCNVGSISLEGDEDYEAQHGVTIYKIRDLTDNITFREVLSLRFPQPFTIDYRDNGVYVSW